VDLAIAKLYVFVDESFANNKDLSSQLEYLIILVNKGTKGKGEFNLHGNLIDF